MGDPGWILLRHLHDPGVSLQRPPGEIYARRVPPPRIGDSKFHVVKDTAAYLFTVFRIVMYFRPLRVFFPMSLLIGAPALVKGWYDWAWSSKHTLQESDIIMVIVMFAVLIVGLLAELIVAQRREPL